MTEKQDLTACVDFATGPVAFIGYKLARLDLTRYGLGVPPGYILVMLRRDQVDRRPSPAWEKLLPGYYGTTGSRADSAIQVRLAGKRRSVKYW
jgi:hypothetical protein